MARTDLALWARHLAVNVTGPFLLTRAVLPGMLGRRWGRIVNVASMAALGGAPYIAAYAASKHALLGLTRAAAAETAGRGVTVNAVCPGFVATDIVWDSARRIADKTGKPFDAAVATLAAFNPSGKLIAPEAVAATVLELAGDAAAGRSGDAVVIDGVGAQTWPPHPQRSDRHGGAVAVLDAAIRQWTLTRNERHGPGRDRRVSSSQS